MKKILIVDDEPDIVDLLQEEMDDNGFQTRIALCGNDAIELLRSELFHAVISDFKMPNGTGMDVLNFINSMESRPMFYFISGQADVSAEMAIKAGAQDFFPKPFNLSKLVERINSDLF